VVAVGSADNPHAHRILAEDGGFGPPAGIGPNHVVLVSNFDQATHGTGVYARVGFDGKSPPLGDGIAPEPGFVDMDDMGLATNACADSPILEVSEGYIRIHQLQANSNAGPALPRDPNGGDLVVLEIWRVGDTSPPPQPPTALIAAAGDGQVNLSWTAPTGLPPSGYNVYQTAPGARKKLNTALITATAFTVGGLPNGTEHCFVVRSVGTAGGESADSGPQPACATPMSAAPIFKRGDVDGNGSLEITDAINLLGFLFLGEAGPTCSDAADTDDNGSLEITDAISSLGFQFLGEAAPPAPGPFTCGPDPTPDAPGAELNCASYPAASCQP
jgi:hypothetical protein